MSNVSISANIPKELSELLEKIAKKEERSKSYYIKKGLEKLLADRLENIEDYNETEELYNKFLASNEQTISFENMKKNLKLD